AVAMGAVRAGGVLTLLSLGTLFLLLWRGESKQRKLKRTLSSFAFLPLFPDAASADAQNIDNLFFFLLALCGFVALVIVCLILYFAIRYRRRTEDQLALWAGSVSWLEWTWTIVPIFIFVGIFLWGVRLYFAAVRPPPEAIDINVLGRQWMWKFQHPE